MWKLRERLALVKLKIEAQIRQQEAQIRQQERDSELTNLKLQQEALLKEQEMQQEAQFKQQEVQLKQQDAHLKEKELHPDMEKSCGVLSFIFDTIFLIASPNCFLIFSSSFGPNFSIAL